MNASSYTPEKGEAVLLLVMCGMSVREIADEEGMPAASTVYVWLLRHKDFAESYRVAREFQCDVFADEIIAIADDGRNDWMEKKDREGGGTHYVLNKEAVLRSKLRIETRLKIMARLAPKKYGDRVTVGVGGDPDAPPVQTETTVQAPSLDAVLAKLAALRKKSEDEEGGGGSAQPAGS